MRLDGSLLGGKANVPVLRCGCICGQLMRESATALTGEPRLERKRNRNLFKPADPVSNLQKLQRIEKYVKTYYGDIRNKSWIVENFKEQKLS